MASQSSSRASSTSMPVGKTSKAWLYFSTKDDPKSQKAVCSLCKKEVARSGGTTNLLSHLQKWHREIYDKLFLDSAHGSIDQYLTNSTKVVKFSSKHERFKSLTSAVCKFIVRDLRPISVVDDIGFLNLMNVAEPRYIVPCRSTIKRRIDERYLHERSRVKASLHSVEYMTCTTDMWTSRASDAYISLTCHFIDQDFTMSYYNLECKHFPGAHDYANIMDMIESLASDWGIDIKRKVTSFTTDSGSNIVKALDVMNIPRLACVGHTLNLAVQKALAGVPRVAGAVARCRKIVEHFNKSRVHAEELQKKRELFPEIPKHKLIQVYIYIYNSVHVPIPYTYLHTYLFNCVYTGC